MLLNIVTDDELLTSQIVKTILLALIAGGIIYNLFRLMRTGSGGGKFANFLILIFLFIIILFVYKQYRIEAALLKTPLYIQGTTMGYCNAFAEGQGIEFEYEIKGQRFTGCSTFHPISKDSIKVPGGKYWVRYSLKFPGEGRMDFQKPVKQNELVKL